MLDDILSEVNQKHLFLLANKVLDILFVLAAREHDGFQTEAEPRLGDVHGGAYVAPLLAVEVIEHSLVREVSRRDVPIFNSLQG